MAGFNSITGDESIIYGDNVSFNGTQRGGKLTTNGQLLIGSSVAPHIRTGNLTSTGGTVTITNGNGTINLESASSVTNSAFLALGDAQPNVTGDGTTYTVIFTLSEPFDTNGAFTTSTFTAPYTGIYLLGASWQISNLTNVNITGTCNLHTTARVYTLFDGSPWSVTNGGGRITMGGSVLANMTAGDTSTVRITVGGGAKTVGLAADASALRFWGNLMYRI